MKAYHKSKSVKNCFVYNTTKENDSVSVLAF